MAVRSGDDWGRAAATRPALAFAAMLLAILTACGGPAFTYVTNSDDRTFVKLPNTWHPIDQRQLDAAIGLDPGTPASEQGIWAVAYDADATPSTLHLTGQHAAAPLAFVMVTDIPAAMRGQFSLDRLRDLIHPVSPAGRQQVLAGPASGLSDFALVGDEILTPGAGLRGVRAVYRYRVDGGPPQVFDKTAYLNDDASKFYLFLVRCSTECYRDRNQEIESAVSSFTVREAT